MVMTVDEAMTAVSVARGREAYLRAYRALELAAQAEYERLLPGAPDWSCHGCRQTWVGGTTPADGCCPSCGELLEEDK